MKSPAPVPDCPARHCSWWLASLFALACAGSPPPEAAAPAPAHTAPVAVAVSPLDPAAIVAAADRTDKDKETDSRRHPVELLQFLKIQPGSHVADLGAGGGYTTELLVRAVGPEGVVYAQNNKLTLEKYIKDAWPERLKREVNRQVVRMDQEYEAPFSAEAKDLDLVTLMFSYHDVIAQGGDRAQLNAAVFAALKPGGSYVIADHRAADGSGLAAADSVHRIEPALVQKEVEAAGFQLAESADFLKDPKDELKEPSYKVGFNTDRFLLKFVKP
jgi:predicted methyltransferase